ncbi:class I SAM-dependent methyltransferase [Kaarinaea lacus]
MSFIQRMREAHRQASQLPAPSAEARAHSEKLQQHILQVIASEGGSISFKQFMELALYAPGLGYYSAGSHKLGREGDFVTAPEISPLFSRCLARAIRSVLQAMPVVRILEVGAGSGIMAVDVMAELALLDIDVDEYANLERSADLAQRQRETVAQRIPQYSDRFTWLSVLPENFSGVVLANELLDALPVHRLIYQQGQWQELYVVAEEKEFRWQIGDLSDKRLAERLQDIQHRVGEPAEGYITEINLAAEDWLRSLLANLNNAVVVLIDYGQPRNVFYHPQRINGSLLCHYRHHAHEDVFAWLGLQDITAHVDFTAMADVALECDCRVNGYTTQAQFLLASGLTELLAGAENQQLLEQVELAAQVRKLTLPQEMGETFKVMAISKNTDLRVKGFELRDMREQL